MDVNVTEIHSKLDEKRLVSSDVSSEGLYCFSTLTQCVLSCQREMEDDMDSYQVPFESPPAAAHPLVHTAA